MGGWARVHTGKTFKLQPAPPQLPVLRVRDLQQLLQTRSRADLLFRTFQHRPGCSLKRNILHCSVFTTEALHQVHIGHHENIHCGPLSIHFDYFKCPLMAKQLFPGSYWKVLQKAFSRSKVWSPKTLHGKKYHMISCNQNPMKWLELVKDSPAATHNLSMGERDEKYFKVSRCTNNQEVAMSSTWS